MRRSMLHGFQMVPHWSQGGNEGVSPFGLFQDVD